MKRFKRLFPVVCITIVTVLISLTLYNTLITHEENQAWQELTTTGQTIVKRIQTKFQDEIVKLHLVKNIMLDSDDPTQGAALHLDVIQPTTMFVRIDVLYPDGTIFSNDQTIRTEEDIDFEEVATKGEYMSYRKVDYLSGKECVYYVLPVMKNDQVRAVLIGVIDTEALTEAFQPLLYNGQADMQLIDTKDGCFIVDTWHSQLGNAYAYKERIEVDDENEFGLQQALREQLTGTVSFYSEQTGEKLYMYLAPVGMFDWQLSIFSNEEVLFSELHHLQRIFVFAGVMEALLLCLYYCWNILTVRQLERSLAENEKQKEALRLLSYQDGLTSLFNRNKYTELKDQMAKQKLQKVGVAYIDLNGLKKINDEQSHGAGDDYIRRTALVLSEIFAGKCYRLGGDEFLVIATDVEQDDFEMQLEEMERRMAEERISVSVGFRWQEECTAWDEMLNAAEQDMYREKEQYYDHHQRSR